MTGFHHTSGGGARTKQLRAAYHQAGIAAAQNDMFVRANAFIDTLLAARDTPSRLQELTELVASSQYGGAEGRVAERSRQAVQTLLDNPASMDCRRNLLVYLIYEVQCPSFNMKASLLNDPARGPSRDKSLPALKPA